MRREIRYVPDDEVGLFFRAADVSVLPYRQIYQSGVVALSYAQGLPVIAARVGSLADDVLDGETGLLFRPGDVEDLVRKIKAYYSSDLFRQPAAAAARIREFGASRFSWDGNGTVTCQVYESLLSGADR